MGKNIVQKVLEEHLIKGKLIPGKEIAIKIDDALLQDATGTLACLEFEEMGISRVKTERTVIFTDHNTLQCDFRNRDDHKYLQSIAAKYGPKISRTGNGICHQVWLERFAMPGRTLLGSDSHTPTAGGAGQLAIGAGGLDVALAMAGQPYHLIMPEVVRISIWGKLPYYVSAKDVVLKILEIFGVKGGKGKALEYAGDGIKTLSVPERATITNMGTETGATMSIFPSDEKTLRFLARQSRPSDWRELKADNNAHYTDSIVIHLDRLEPLVACPHSPGNIKKVSELKGLKIGQVMVGSCTNSSLLDMKKVALMLEGKKVHPDVDLVVAPGSRQVLWHLAHSGDLEKMVEAGARILESACGPCVGVGQAPGSKGVSLRTTNRNFKGRSGTDDAEVYLVSPETAAASAIKGKLTDPREIREPFEIISDRKFHVDDSRILEPPKTGKKVKIVRGPNIVKLPKLPELSKDLSLKVLIKVEDNISTDDILPAGAKILPLRSNLPEIEKYTFSKLFTQVAEQEGVKKEKYSKTVKSIRESESLAKAIEIFEEAIKELVGPEYLEFYKRAKKAESEGLQGIIIGGENYGQGSSREHAALAPRDLGVLAVLVKSFARIHADNLVNFGVLPLEFADKADYERIQDGDQIEILNVRDLIGKAKSLKAKNVSQGYEFEVKPYLFSPRAINLVKAGGVLNWLKKK